VPPEDREQQRGHARAGERGEARIDAEMALGQGTEREERDERRERRDARERFATD
jgi:hypothetical protein